MLGGKFTILSMLILEPQNERWLQRKHPPSAGKRAPVASGLWGVVSSIIHGIFGVWFLCSQIILGSGLCHVQLLRREYIIPIIIGFSVIYVLAGSQV